jgi:hypothetical protein
MPWFRGRGQFSGLGVRWIKEAQEKSGRLSSRWSDGWQLNKRRPGGAGQEVYIYMSRMKIVVLGLLAVFAVSAVASSSAFAHEWLVNQKAIAKGEKVEIQGNQIPGINQLEDTIAKLSVHISCQLVIVPAAGNILTEGGRLEKFKTEYKACTVTTVSGGVVESQPKCKVKEFAVEGTGELSEAGIVSLKEKEKVGLATIHIEEVTGAGACTLAGEFKVEGSQICTLPHYAVDVDVAVLECNPAGSKELKLGSEPAKLYSSVGLSATKGQTLGSN